MVVITNGCERTECEGHKDLGGQKKTPINTAMSDPSPAN